MESPKFSRRQFLISSSAIAGGFALGWGRIAAAAESSANAAGGMVSPSVQPALDGSAMQAGAQALTDWVRITKDNVVTLVVSQAEMGQGITTTLPAILCDELGADWPKVRFELAPTAEPYRNPRIQWQFTGNSESTQSFNTHMRQIGASARTMLTTAAAQQWQVPEAECTTSDGRVIHRPSGKSMVFGDIAEAAAKIAPPAKPILRPDAELKLVGRALPRVDIPAKIDGSALFGIDYIPPGLQGVLFAAVRSAPAYGGKPVKVDHAAIKAYPGVVEVVELPTAVAVVAHKYWQARAALAAADIGFDAGSHPEMSSASLHALYLDKMKNGAVKVVAEVAAEVAAGAAPKPHAQFSAQYELPFHAHATMEPMNALAHVQADQIDVWAPTQGQELAKLTLAGMLKRDPKTVRIHRSPFLGGGFGRRLLPDFCIDAALISQAVGKPVKAIWSREEDIRRDSYRPATLHRISADLDQHGMPLAVTQRLVSPTILKPVLPPLDLSKGIDPSAIEGTEKTRYNIPGWRTEFHLLDIPVPTSVYRTTGFGPSQFGWESFIDELAHRAKVDPYQYRRKLLEHDTRALAVLDEVAKRSGWGKPLPKGRARGIAFSDAFDTVLAQVVEITVKKKTIRIDRVVTVADPGRVFDPKIAEAGIEGGILFGLSTAVKDEITFEHGGPKQTNFHEYDFVRMRDTPKIEVYFIESHAEPLGAVGEVGPVAAVPALANAIFAATGTRLHTLPLKRSGFSLA
jgi:isoquinoline 1-oxidoreductase beta subunit